MHPPWSSKMIGALGRMLLPRPIVDDSDAASSFRRVPWSIFDVLLGLVFLLAIRFLPVSYFRLFAFIPGVAYYTVTSGLPKLLMALIPKGMAKFHGQRILDRLPSRQKIITELAISVPLALGIMGLLLIGQYVYTMWTGKSLATAEKIAFGYARDEAVAYLLMSFTLVPLVEEIFFRGFLYNGLRRFFGPTALILQAMLFALSHTYNVVQVWYIFFIGLLLGLIYEWRKSLLVTVGIHTCINLAWAIATLAVIHHLATTPYLGVGGESEAGGYRVTTVAPDSPAQAAGIREQDLVTRVDHTPITSRDGLVALLEEEYQIGEEVTVYLTRDRQLHEFKIQLGRRPERAYIQP